MKRLFIPRRAMLQATLANTAVFLTLLPAGSVAQIVQPNDPLYGSQWHLPRIGAPAAWARTTGSTNIVVAVIDNGVDYLHEDLAPNMWRNPGETGLDGHGRDKATNGIDDDNNGYVDDVHGVDLVNGTGDPMDHGSFNPPSTSPLYFGTANAGIIGAAGNNGEGVSGINWSVRIMAIRAIGGDRSDIRWLEGAWGRVAAGVNYARQMKQRGVNVRVIHHGIWGRVESAALRDAIAAAGSEGILSVCPTTDQNVNHDNWANFPSCFNLPCIISVARSTSSDELFLEGVLGPSTIDLAAPAEAITTTWRGSPYSLRPGNPSFAVAQVAGAAALLLAADPSLTVNQVKAALFGSVDQPPTMRGRLVTHGRLNVGRALEWLQNPNPPAIVITALPAGQRTRASDPIQVDFNRPMNRATVESAFVIEPPISGTFEWSEDSFSFVYHHQAPFDTASRYTVRILASAEDESGEALDGDFDRITREGSPEDDFVWTFSFPIPNDDFANAQWLTGATGSVESNNRYATQEVDEPRTVLFDDWRLYGNSLWYRWSPPEPGGWFTFDLTRGTTFNSMLVVYTGDALARLVPIAANDDFAGQSSRVSFKALAGTDYSIVVASKGEESDIGQTGPFTLDWYPTPMALKIRLLPQPNLVELSWPETNGVSLLRTDNLSTKGTWNVAPVVSSRLTNGIRVVTVTNAVPSRYFRLLQL